MSSFGAKRKARIIKIDDEGGAAQDSPVANNGDAPKDGKFSQLLHATHC